MKHRVVIFEKNGQFGCISVADDGETASLTTYDPRCGVKDARALLPSGALQRFVEGEILVTVERGWRMVYDGEPNDG